MRYIYQTKRDTVYTYPIPKSNHVYNTYSYHYPSSVKAIFSEISSAFIKLKDICTAQINVKEHSNEQFPARRTFVSHKRHSNLISGSLAELRHVEPKHAKAKITTTTQK